MATRSEDWTLMRSRRLLITLALLVAGCQREEDRDLARLLDASAAVAYSRESISSLEPAAVGLEEALRSPAKWLVSGADLEHSGDSETLVVKSSSVDLRLEAAVAFDASRVDVIRVVLHGLAAPALPELSWTLQGGDACAACTLRMLAREGAGPDRSVFSFEVGARAEWHGTITRMILRPTTIRENRIEVGQISFLKRSMLPAERDVFDRVVLFSADGESRPGRILAPGRAFLTRKVERRDETLRFAVAREPSAALAAGLRVSEIGSSGASRSLFEGNVAPGRGWQDFEVKLSGRRAEDVQFVFEVASGAASPGLSDLLFLAGVELETRARDSGRMNVLLVSLDTLRADRLSAYGYSRPTSPNLEELVRSGAVLFENVVAAASSTLPAHASMLSGLEVFEHGAFLDRPVAPRQVMLPELFQESGYRTLAITGGGYVHPRFGLSQGFDRFRAWPRGELDNGLELSDGLDRFQTWLDVERDHPFFFFFHTYEVHSPYRAREPFFSSLTGKTSTQVIEPWGRAEQEEEGYFTRDRWPRTWGAGEARDLAPSEVPRIGELYDSGVARADFAVGELLRFLRQRGLDEKTLVVVTADHGESLGENGFFSHGYMYDTNLLVPLVIFDPRDRRRHARIRRQVRQIDIMPTILELAGLEPETGISGQSLVKEMAGGETAPGREAWSYGPEVNHGVSLRRDGLKFVFRDSILRPRSKPDWEAYALRRDPAESRTLSREELPSFEALRAAAIGKLERAAGGVFVAWENRSQEDVRGVLRIPGMNTHNSKLGSAPTGSFLMPNPGELQFEIPRGKSSRAHFHFPGGAIELGIRLQGAWDVAEASVDIGLADLCGQTRTLISSSPAAGAGHFEMTLSGGCDPVSGASEDPELAARLRALGYLR